MRISDWSSDVCSSDLASSACFIRVCRLAGIEGATLHTLRHTFASVAGELGFTELTIRAMLRHASQNVTQAYIHIDAALNLAATRTPYDFARLTDQGAGGLPPPSPAPSSGQDCTTRPQV